MRFGRRLAWGWSNRSKINQLKFSKNSHPLYQPIYLPAKVLVEDEWILWAVERWRGCHLWRSTACTPHRPWVQALLIVFLGGDLFGDYLAKKAKNMLKHIKALKFPAITWDIQLKNIWYTYIYVRKYIYKFLNVIYIYTYFQASFLTSRLTSQQLTSGCMTSKANPSHEKYMEKHGKSLDTCLRIITVTIIYHNATMSLQCLK